MNKEVIKFNYLEFDKDKNYVIEASAGTGKTFNIVKMVDNLVNFHHEDLNKILIVTYTDKAAGELKSKLRKELKNSDVDNAPIYTIHSFCKAIINEFGISASLPLSLNVIGEDKLIDFTNRYIREKEFIEKVKTEFPTFDLTTLDTLATNFKEGLKKYYLNNEYKEDPSISSLEKSKEEVKKILEFKLQLEEAKTAEDYFKIFPDFKINFEIMMKSSDSKSLEFMNHIIENKMAIKGGDAKSKFIKNTKKWLKDDELISAYNYFISIIEKVKNTPSIYASFVYYYLDDFYKKFQEEKELNKEQNFDDMIRFVREKVLNDEIFKNKLQEKFNRAIIDEFQDTNQKQFDIFKSIFLEDDNHKIIVVGDPKQSIYSFQGADVNVYYKAKEDILKKENSISATLNKNYRSSKEIVNSCNKIFSFYNFKGSNFEPSDYRKGEEETYAIYKGKRIKALKLVTKDNIVLNNKNDFYYAKVVAEKILDYCTYNEDNKTNLQLYDKDSKSFRNVTFKDFMILYKSRYDAIKIISVFKKLGIPYTKFKDQALFSGKECQDWIVLLEAININDFTGKNRNIFKKTLFTSFFGKSLKDISNEIYNADDSDEFILLKYWKELASSFSYEKMIDSILTNPYINESLNNINKIQTLSIYKQLGSYLIEYLSNGHTIYDAINHLKKQSKNDNSDNGENKDNIIDRSTDFDAVGMITMHSSKGLQYPIVIIASKFSNEEIIDKLKGKAFIYHNDKNELKLTFEKNKNILDESVEEAKRLYYVAYTRSEYLLISPYIEEKSSTYKFIYTSLTSYINENKGDFDFINSNYKKYDELKKETKKILAHNSKSIEDSKEKEEQRKIISSLIKESINKKTFKHSYTSLSHNSLIEKEEIDDTSLINKEGELIEGLSRFDKNGIVISSLYNEEIKPISIPASFPKGAKIGTILHEIFEKLDFTNYKNEILNVSINAFKNQGIDFKDEYKDVVYEIVENVLNASLKEIKGNKETGNTFSLREINLINKKAEVEFNFNLLNERLRNYCNGFIDLIFIRDGYYSVLDWKSDSLNIDFDSYSNKDSIIKHMDDSYSVQRVLYSYTLIKYLKTIYKDENEEMIFSNHFGGIYYAFLRGCNKNSGNGIYMKTWNNFKELKDSFDEIISSIGGNNND